MSDKIIVSLSNSQSYDVKVKEDKKINANILDPNYIPKYREYEAERQKNELERISNENERKDNENKRISNESSREAYVEQLKKDAEGQKDWPDLCARSWHPAAAGCDQQRRAGG